MIVIDSSVLIAHLRGERRVTAFLRREAARGTLLVPALVAWELWKGADSAMTRRGVEALLAAVTVDPFTPEMARLAGELHIEHREEGRERPTFDLLIASHALHHGAPLATLDRDYTSVNGLEVVKVK